MDVSIEPDGGEDSSIGADAGAGTSPRALSASSIPGAVSRVPVNGGRTTVLATGGTPQGIVVDSANVYWADFSQILVAPLEGVPDAGAGSVLVPNEGGSEIGGLVVAGSMAYWTDESAIGSLDSAPTRGAGPVTTLLAGLSQPLGLAVDSRNLYVCELSPTGFVAQLSR